MKIILDIGNGTKYEYSISGNTIINLIYNLPEYYLIAVEIKNGYKLTAKATIRSNLKFISLLKLIFKNIKKYWQTLLCNLRSINSISKNQQIK